jgi:hypothetical protein
VINDFDIEGFKALAENLAATGVRLNPRREAAISLSRDPRRDMFAADKDRGDRAAWLASGSNRTFEEWKADQDAEALRLAQDSHAAVVAEADAKKLAVEVRKAEAAARKAEKELAKAKALAEKAAAEAEKDALPVDYKGLYEALSGLFTVTTDRKLGLLLELQAQHERTFELTLHQFMRLGGEWWNEDFKKMVGHRATAIFKEIFPGAVPSGAVGVALDARLDQSLVRRQFRLGDRPLVDRALPTKTAAMRIAVGALTGRGFGCASWCATYQRHSEQHFFVAVP